MYDGAVTTDHPGAIIRRPGEGTSIRGPVGGPLVFLARGAETGGALTAFENVIAPGNGPPLHVHAVENEAWYVIDGTLRFRMGDEVTDAPAGSFVFVPHGMAHALTNPGDTPARVLVLLLPSGGMERFFETYAETPEGVDDAEAFARAATSAGMTVLGPPMGPEAP